MLLVFLSVASIAMLGAAFGQEDGELAQSQCVDVCDNKRAFVLPNNTHHRVCFNCVFDATKLGLL